MLCHISIGNTHHAGEAHAISIDGLHLDVFMQLTILMAYTRSMEIKVHTSQSFDETQQSLASIDCCHINLSCHIKVGQQLLSAGSHTHRPSPFSEQYSHLAAYAR